MGAKSDKTKHRYPLGTVVDVDVNVSSPGLDGDVEVNLNGTCRLVVVGHVQTSDNDPLYILSDITVKFPPPSEDVTHDQLVYGHFARLVEYVFGDEQLRPTGAVLPLEETVDDWIDKQANLAEKFWGGGGVDDTVKYVDFRRLSAEKDEKHLREALERKPNDAKSMVDLGNFLARRARHTAAMKFYRKACRVQPELWEAHYNLACCLCQIEDFAKGIRSYKRAMKLAPDAAHVRFNLASALSKVGKYREAARHWRRYLKLEPNGQWAPQARKRLARIEQSQAR